MRITPDTNVLASAFISKRGQPAAILDLALTFSEIELVLSEPIILEFGDVLSRKEVRERFNYTSKEVSEFADALRSVSTMVGPTSTFKVVPEDPEDDVVIATGFDGKADYIVSGDHHLQGVKKSRGIRIVSPKTMIDIISRKFGRLVMEEL